MNNPAPEVPLSSPEGRVVLTTVVLGSALASITATVVNIALPTVATALHASSAAQSWIVNAYVLTLASFILIGGTLGDRFGRLLIYRIGIAWFAVASLLCAVAWDVPSLICFRLLQGVGAALLTPGSLAILESSLQRSDRGRGVGLWSGISGVTGAIGPLVGGVLVGLSWRWVFVMSLPIAVVVLVLSRWVPESSDPTAKSFPIDVEGALLVAVALGTASYALIEGPNDGFSLLEQVAAVAAVVSLVVLVLRERGRPHAMVPTDLFANRTFAVTNGLTFVIYGAMGVLFFLLSIQLQVTAGWSPVGSGAALLPVTALMLVLSPRMGALSSKVGPRPLLSAGSFVMALGMLVMTRIGPGASFVADVLPAVMLFGIGLSTVVAPVTSTALDSVPVQRVGAASGVNNAVSRIGSLLAVAAIPGIVGLTGDALSTASLLDAGFDKAMLVAAGLLVLAAVAALVALPSGPVSTAGAGDGPGTAQGSEGSADGGSQHVCNPCPVDGQASNVASGGRAG